MSLCRFSATLFCLFEHPHHQETDKGTREETSGDLRDETAQTYHEEGWD